jgi:rhodanese-related sulfurtransferase
MSESGKTVRHREVTALELQAMLADGMVTLVDVREPGEFAAEHIRGAINKPLSSFDPAELTLSAGKAIVLQCAGGKRSGKALDQCIKANSVIDAHLGGGLDAWNAAGLPTIR